jgi:hypothetical protein
MATPARWNVISVCAPCVGFLGGIVAGASAPHMHWFEWGFSLWLVFSVAGLLSAVIALYHSERLSVLTAVGLLLNGSLAFGLFSWLFNRGVFFSWVFFD